MKARIRSLIVSWLWWGAQRKVTYEKPYVLTISGSVGKTSSKDAIATVLEQSGKPVERTRGNLGTDTGVPLSLLGFEEAPSGVFEWLKACFRVLFPPKRRYKETPYYVLEYSSDKPGDIPFLAAKIPFKASILTRIVPTHMAFYPEFKDLVEEETSVLEYLQPGGYLIANADDPSQKAKGEVHQDVTWYGLVDTPTKNPGVWGHSWNFTDKGITFLINFNPNPKTNPQAKQKSTQIEVGAAILGKHHIYPLLAAAAVGFREGLSFEQIKKGLELYQTPNGRGRIISGHKEMTLIDDTYNASPEAVKAGLDMLVSFAGKRRKVAILGTMNELGNFSEQAHQEVGAYTAGKVDFLVTVGKFSEITAAAAKKAGLPEVHILNFAKTEQLLYKLEQVTQARDVVYLKGSQNGVRLERAVKALMSNPEKAEQLLVRQSSYWKAHI